MRTVLVLLIFALFSYSFCCIWYFNKLQLHKNFNTKYKKSVKEILISFDENNFEKNIILIANGQIENKQDLILSLKIEQNFLKENSNEKLFLKCFFKSNKAKDRVNALKKIEIVSQFLVKEKIIEKEKIVFALTLLPLNSSLKKLNEISIELKN